MGLHLQDRDEVKVKNTLLGLKEFINMQATFHYCQILATFVLKLKTRFSINILHKRRWLGWPYTMGSDTQREKEREGERERERD